MRLIYAHVVECIITIQVNFIILNGYLSIEEEKRYGVYVVKRENGRKVLTKAKERRSITAISHVNSNKLNNLNTSNSDDVKITSNFPYSTIKNDNSSNTLITLPKINDTESSVCIDDEKTDLNHIIDDIPYNKSSS